MSRKAVHGWLMVVVAMIGCSPEPFTYDRPLVEPTQADRPDSESVATISRELKSASIDDHVSADWPMLFGRERTSVTEARLDPVWPATGPELIWEVPVGTGYGSPVAGAGRTVFNYRDGDEEIVQCHDVITGELMWQHRYPTTAVCDFEYSDGPYSTPIIDTHHGRVFNVGGQGQFSCLDLASGEVIWSRDLFQEYCVEADIFPVGASPLLDLHSCHPAGQLIFNLGAYDRGAGIISVDPASGKTIWEATEQGPSYGTPFVAEIHDQRFAFVLTDEGLVCLDPDCGEVDWQIPFRRRGHLVRNATSPLVDGDRVLVVCSGIGGMCVRVQPDRGYEQVWRQRRTLDSQYNTLILGEDHVYSFTSGGQGGAEFRCVSMNDGELIWKYHSVLKRGMGLATPDAIFLLGERGHLASLMFTAEEPKVVSFTEKPLMSEPCYCSPAIYGQYIILKDETRVAVFELGEAQAR